MQLHHSSVSISTSVKMRCRPWRFRMPPTKQQATILMATSVSTHNNSRECWLFNQIYTFKNIRFGAPPVGDLRWVRGPSMMLHHCRQSVQSLAQALAAWSLTVTKPFPALILFTEEEHTNAMMMKRQSRFHQRLHLVFKMDPMAQYVFKHLYQALN